MGRSAGVYRVNARLVVVATPRTTMGVGLDRSPIRVSPNEPAALAAALATSLTVSEVVVGHPAQSEWKDSFDPVLKAAGVRSHKAFMATAELLGIDDDGRTASVTLYRNVGAKEGFRELGACSETVASGDVSALADLVLRQFEGAAVSCESQ